jgi:hypothetical protein
MPAKAGMQGPHTQVAALDRGLRRGDIYFVTAASRRAKADPL